MAFARLLIKSRKINKLVTILDGEKQKSAQASRGKEVKYTVRQKWRHFWLDQRVRIKKFLRRILGFRKGSCLYRLKYKIGHDGTCENFTLKSIGGFIGGFLLTYIFFMFFVLQLNFKLSTATIMCSIFGSILTIGLAFSFKVRCVVLLLLPQFFSKRGRQALMAYAFILAITGPAKNTLHNMGILSESLACGQEQLKSAVRQILDAIKKPLYAIRDAIKTVVKTVKVVVKKIKEIMLTIKRIIVGIVRVIKAAFQFLAKILNVCNKELGTPFQRCMRAFEDAILDCNAKLGPFFNWLCSITYLVQTVCYIVKIFDFICLIIDFISDSIVGVIFKKIKIFIRHVKTMFYVRIKFSHSFHFETNQTKSVKEVAEGIVTEVRQRTEKLLAFFDFMSCATSMFFLVLVVRVLHYRYKFLTSDRFDNRYITKNFRNIDIRRAQLEKETVLPLNHRERALYINVRSIRLVKIERHKLAKAAIAIGIVTLKLSTHMMTDYALYWMLMTIRYHARFQSKIQAPNVASLRVEGNGFIANLLRSVVTAFQPLGLNIEIDTIPCLPDPIPPITIVTSK
ncbi:hypothetical protein FQR65_LT09983 [Abscondita terminalis]|nr:hypothetical protein FQR65_LT09983 [Abscondita terminalis]